MEQNDKIVIYQTRDGQTSIDVKPENETMWLSQAQMAVKAQESLTDEESPRCKSSLKDMTLEELWELFPIVLTPHNHKWADWAKQEIELLSALLAGHNPIINHIGSTAIPGIQAKPIVDILVEVSPDADWLPIKETLEANGYICMSESEMRISFNKGYTPEGYADKVFHIHFHRTGDNDEILFRDYLIAHPDIAGEYERLKTSLLPKYRNNRDGYTEAKSDFVQRIIRTSKTEDKQ